MSMMQINETVLMAMAGSRIRPRQQPTFSDAAHRPLASVDTTVPCRPHRVLKVMVVVTGRERSDGFELAVRRWGHEVDAVHHGSTALEMARESQPDVVVIEIDTAFVGRCHLARLLRDELARDDCLIIAVTGQADRESSRLCREAGIDVVLSMPVNPAVLETLLWMESTHLNRLCPDRGDGADQRPERLHGTGGVEPYYVRHAEGTSHQMEMLERVRVAAGQTS